MSKHVSLLPPRSVSHVGINAAGLLLRTSNSMVKRSFNQSAKDLNLPLPVPVESASNFPFHSGYYIPVASGLCAVGGVAYWVYQQWTTPIMADSPSKLVQVYEDDFEPPPIPPIVTWVQAKWEQALQYVEEVLATPPMLSLITWLQEKQNEAFQCAEEILATQPTPSLITWLQEKWTQALQNAQEILAPLPMPPLVTWLLEKWSEAPRERRILLVGTTITLILFYWWVSPFYEGRRDDDDDGDPFGDKVYRDVYDFVERDEVEERVWAYEEARERRMQEYEERLDRAQRTGVFGGYPNLARGCYATPPYTSYPQNPPMMWQGDSLYRTDRSLDDWESYYRLSDYVSSTTGSTRPVDGQMGRMDEGAYLTPRSSYTQHNPYAFAYSYDNASAVGSTTPQSSYPVRVPPHQTETLRPTPSPSSPPAYSSGPSSSSSHYSPYQDFPYARSSASPPTRSGQRQKAQRPPRAALHEIVETETDSSDEEDTESDPDPDPYSYASLLAKHRRNIQSSYCLL